VRGGIHQKVLDVDLKAPDDIATTGRGLVGLPLPDARERHGIANRQVLAATMDHMLLVPVAGAEVVDVGAAQRTGRRDTEGKLDRATAAASSPAAFFAAVMLTRRGPTRR
jgi:hypothetical protein